MKKIFAIATVAVAMLFAGNSVNAQLSINAGFANQAKTFTGTAPVFGTYTDRDTSMNGFFVGVSYNIKLSGDLSVAPGIYYQNLSHGTSTDLYVTTLHTKSVEQAIAVPILFNYGFEFNKNLKVFVFAGPNVTYGLTKTFTWWLGDNEPADPSADYYKGDSPINSNLNIFGTVGAGLQYHQLRFQAGYNYGFLDRTKSDNTTEKVNNVFVGVGYEL